MLESQSFGRVLYFGIDESNHGRDNEVFACILSEFLSDSQPISLTNRTRTCKNPWEIFDPDNMRDFRYALVNRLHYSKYGQHNLSPLVIHALVSNFDFQAEKIVIEIDGEFRQSQEETLRGLFFLEKEKFPTIHIMSFPKRKIKREGKTYFTTTPLVSYADCLANYLYRQKTLADLEYGEISRKRVKFE